MQIKSFLKLVEIQTKVASIIPYMIGTFFVLYKFGQFKMKQAVILFLGMLVFDMTTTAINNYVDYVKAIKKEGFGYEQHNAITKYQLKPKQVLGVIICMLIIASLLGIILVLNTDFIVLVMGVFCFIIGICYSFGPIPISRTPFGEIFSGIVMGFFITFLAVYVHIYDQGILKINLTNQGLGIWIGLKTVIQIGIVSIPPIMGIANIMLANNICDIEEDIVNKRYTLPIYIGKEAALSLFKVLYEIAFVGIVIAVVLQILPSISLLTLLTIKLIYRNVKIFALKQSKAETFILAVKNFVLLNGVYVVTIILAALKVQLLG